MHLLLVSHGELAQGMLGALTMLMGPQPNVSAVSLTEEGVGSFRERLGSAFASLPATEDVLIMADLRGGTPCNEAYALLLGNPGRVRVVTGLNLPMLLTVAIEAQDGANLGALCQLAFEAGAQGVCEVGLPSSEPASTEDDLF